jgi:CubicO group peptidase (beta-lactamase class C family)
LIRAALRPTKSAGSAGGAVVAPVVAPALGRHHEGSGLRLGRRRALLDRARHARFAQRLANGAGAWFWVDPTNDIVFVGMIQRMIGAGMPNLQELSRTLVQQALVRP